MEEPNKEMIINDPPERKSSGFSISSIIYSFAKKASTVGVIYFVGYMNWSIAWFIGPVVLLVIRDQFRKEHEFKRNIAKAAALANEKDVVLARIDDLPAWVFFPDVERTEWLNRILKQVWPYVNNYAREVMRDKVQPAIKKSLEKYKLSGFQFDRMILGSIPPRIGGVKVYDRNTARNEIIMDVDVFYAGDCDINFILSGVKGGIKDFQLHGMVRVVMKPLISRIPFMGGLQVFFLNNPSIDFNLVGVADVLDMPGLSDLLRRVIIEQVAAVMVLPNKLPIQLSEGIESDELKMPEPEGVLRVHVVEAKNLMKKDIGMLGKGKSDPYAVISVGAQEFKTKTIDNTTDPKWDYWCEFIILESNGQQLFLHTWDFDEASNDEALGRATIEVANIAKKGGDNMWVTLEQAKHGMVHLRFTWLKLSKSYADLQAAIAETQMLRVTAMSTALLTVYIDSAKNLPQARPQSKPDPYVVVTVGKNSQQTAMQKRASDPVFEQGFMFLVANPESDSLYFIVMDQKTGNELGQFTFSLSSLADKPDLEVDKQPFPLLKSGPHSKLVFSVHLRILKHSTPETEKVGPAGDAKQLTHQSSTVSQSSDNTVPPKKQMSREGSLKSNSDQTGVLESAGVEEFIEESTAFLQSATPPQTPGGLTHRQPSITSSAGEAGLGRIQLTLRYSIQRQRLIVVVHKVAHLPQKDPSSIPDPYVKLYLLPERAKETKRRTHVVKDNCNPVFDETFEYLVSQGELNAQQLEVTVGTQKQLFSAGSNIMGQVVVELNKYNITQPYTSWFDLQPEIDRD